MPPIPALAAVARKSPQLDHAGESHSYAVDSDAVDSDVGDSDLAHSRCGERCAVMSSSCGDGEGYGLRAPSPSPFFAPGCADLLHEFSDLLAVVLRNAQRLQWMLPRYSRMKRTVVEIARGAQRSAELLEQLRRRGVVAAEAETNSTQAVAAAACRPAWPGSVQDTGEDDDFDDVARGQVPKCAPRGSDLTAQCDTCTSDGFPKRDDIDRCQLSRR